LFTEAQVVAMETCRGDNLHNSKDVIEAFTNSSELSIWSSWRQFVFHNADKAYIFIYLQILYNDVEVVTIKFEKVKIKEMKNSILINQNYKLSL